MNKNVVLTLLLFLIIPSVSSLGITPGRSTFDYSPGKVVNVNFEVINSDNDEMDIVVLAQGDLGESISVSEVSFHMSSEETSKSLTYTFEMPVGLEPGLHKGEIAVLKLPEKSSTSEAFVGTAIGVATQLNVHVPYPGKYAESVLDVIGPNSDGEITFVIPVVSRGDLDLARVRGTIDIFSSLNEKIETLSTNEISVLSGERGEVVVKWDSTTVNSGKYLAVATLIYDEETSKLEKEFSVGNKLLELLQIEVNNFVLGGIAKFELLVENKWGDAIKGAYSQMQVFNSDGEVMAEFKSATQDIPPLEKKILVAFWDTAGVKEGNYESTLSLNYGSQSERQDLSLEVKPKQIKVIGVGYVISQSSSNDSGNTMTIVLITLVVVLILINLLWFLVLRKKLSKKK